MDTVLKKKKKKKKKKKIWYHFITWPILVKIISNFNSMCKKHSKFCLMFFLFQWKGIPEKKKNLNIELWVMLTKYEII